MAVRERISHLSRKLPIAGRFLTWPFLLRAGGMLLALLLQVLLTRTLGTEQYGIYAVANSWMQIALLLGTTGFPLSAVKFIPACRSINDNSSMSDFVAFGGIWVFCFSTFLGVLFITVGNLITHSSSLGHTMVAAGLVLPIAAIIRMSSGVLRGLRKINRSQVPELVAWPSLLSVLLLLLGLAFPGKKAAQDVMFLNLAAAILVAVCSGPILFRIGHLSQGNITSRIRRWLLPSMGMMLAAGASVLLARTGTILLGFMSNPTEAGVFSVSYRLASVQTVALLATNAGFGPMASELHANGNKEALSRAANSSALAAFGCSLFIMAAILLFRQSILNLFGRDFRAGTNVLALLALSQLLNAFAGPAIILLNMTGYHLESVKCLGFGVALNVLLGLTLVPKYGAIGAAIASALSVTAWNLLAVLSVRTHLGLWAVALPSFANRGK